MNHLTKSQTQQALSLSKVTQYKGKLQDPEEIFEQTLQANSIVKVDINLPTHLVLDGLGRYGEVDAKEKKRQIKEEQLARKKLAADDKKQLETYLNEIISQDFQLKEAIRRPNEDLMFSAESATSVRKRSFKKKKSSLASQKGKVLRAKSSLEFSETEQDMQSTANFVKKFEEKMGNQSSLELKPLKDGKMILDADV